VAFASAAVLQVPVAGAEGPPPRPLEVQVIGERPDALGSVPGSGTVVSAAEIRRADPQDAAEMLRRVPGVVVRQEQSAGLRFDVGIRGINAMRGHGVLVLEDGVPLAVNPYAEPDLYFAPLIERVRAIEVVKGGGNILYGPQTIAGVINFVTVPLPDRTEAKLDVTGGDHGYARYLARYGDAVGRVRWLLQVLHKQGNGFRGEDFRVDDVMAKASLPTGARGELVIKLGFHDERARSTEVGLTQPMFLADPLRPTFTPDDALEARRIEASLLHSQKLTDAITLRTLAYAYTTSRLWRRQDYDRAMVPGVAYDRIVGDTSVPDGALFFRSTTTIIDRTFDVAALEPKLVAQARTGVLEHTIDAGARLLLERGHRQQRAGTLPTSDAGDLTLDETHTSIAIAAYLADDIRFRDDLHAVPGVRVEHVDYHRDIGRMVVGTAPRDVAISGESGATALIPGVGLRAGPRVAYAFGGVHVGFAPPRVDTAVGATGQDQHVSPERSVNYELGVRAAPVAWVSGEVTGFVMDYANEVLPTGTGNAGGVGLADAGRTRHLGVETALVLSPGRAFHLGTSIDVSARYTFARATFADGRNAGVTLPYAPQQLASVVLDVEHPIGVGASFAWSFVGEQVADDVATGAVDASGRVGRLAPYNLVDLGARYREPRTHLAVRVAVKNLLNDIYVASRRPDGIFIGAPRQVFASLGWDYR
jgi:Fe(3+) dicitrate transport protein